MTTGVKRGWTSAGLRIISSDDTSYWSTKDAAMMLGTEAEQIRNLIRLTGLTPAGKRHGHARRGGRYVRVYSAVDLIRAFETVSEITSEGVTESGAPREILPESHRPESSSPGVEKEMALPLMAYYSPTALPYYTSTMSESAMRAWRMTE